MFVWWPPLWHGKSRGRSVWRRAVSSDAKRLGWYCLETIEAFNGIGWIWARISPPQLPHATIYQLRFSKEFYALIFLGGGSI